MLRLGDCLEIMKELPDNSVDSIVTDPPYGLGFMNKGWDTFDKSQFGIAGNEGQNDLKVKKNFNILPRYNNSGLYDFTIGWVIQALRLLKPGGHLLSFGGTRTYHRMACAVEDAGFEIRDCIFWVYGSGFPKSLNIGKAVDKLQGNEREVIGTKRCGIAESPFGSCAEELKHIPETKGNSEWEGWGTALKPAVEPIVLARKPLSEKNIAENVLKWGTGGINIDRCRVKIDIEKELPVGDAYYLKKGKDYPNQGKSNSKIMGADTERVGLTMTDGRFPANLIHDGSEEVVELFPNCYGKKPYKKLTKFNFDVSGVNKGQKYESQAGLGEFGSASRFFMKCEPSLIDLCFTQKCDIMSIWKHIFVNTAETLLGIIRATKDLIAPSSVADSQGELNDPLVKSAVSHAELCEIFIALLLVEIKTLDSSPETLQAIRDSISNSNECIQLLNLVLSVVSLGSTDITQITKSLLTSFGFVNPAITNCIHETTKSAQSRLIYTPKASKAERGNNNNHPTVKPISLMRYLCRLITPPNGIVLDPFMGSGSTGIATKIEGFDFIGIEKDEGYFKIAEARIARLM